MKKNLIVAAIAAAAMFTSCTKEQGYGDIETPGESAYISINIAEATSRAITGAEDEIDEDAKINNMIIFVTRADGKTFDVSPYYLSTSTIDGDETLIEKIEMLATTKADQIYIVTNTGPFLTGPFKDVRDMDDVKAVALKTTSNTHGLVDYSCKSGNVWMAGEASGLFAASSTPYDHDDNDETPEIPLKKATIQLNYIVAKVYVITKNNMTGSYGTNTELRGVMLTNAGVYTGAVLNSSSTYEVARTTDYPQFPFYNNGVTLSVASAAPSAYADMPAQYNSANDFATDGEHFTNTDGFAALVSGSDTAAALNDDDAFYVVPTRSGSGNHVWVSVYGKYNSEGLDGDDDTKNDDAYWSVAFGGTDNVIDEELTAGRKYIINMNLKGNDNGGGGYEDDPTIETVEEYLEIEIKAAEWIVKKYEKTIQ